MPRDLLDLGVIGEEIGRMAGGAAEGLRRHALFARTVTIKVRYSDFTTTTGSHTVAPATRDVGELSARAVALLGRTEAGQRPVRLLGVAVHGLVPSPCLDDDRETRSHLLPFPSP
jgi:DNA polymerase IV